MLRGCGLPLLALSLAYGGVAKELASGGPRKNAPRLFDAAEVVNKALEAEVASLLPSLDGKGKTRKTRAALHATAARRLATARKLNGNHYVEHIEGRASGWDFCATSQTGLHFFDQFKPPRCVKDNGDVVEELSVHEGQRAPYAASLSPAEFERACGARGGRVLRDRSCNSVLQDWMHNGHAWPYSHHFERETPDLPERWPECCQAGTFQVPRSSTAPDDEGFSMCLPGEYVQPDHAAGKQCKDPQGWSDFEDPTFTHFFHNEAYENGCSRHGGQFEDLMCQEVERLSRDPYLNESKKLVLRKVRKEVRERCCSRSPPSRDNAGDICPGALLNRDVVQSRCCGVEEPEWPKPLEEPSSGSEQCRCVGKSPEVRVCPEGTHWRDCDAEFSSHWNNWQPVTVPASYGERCMSHVSNPSWDPQCFNDGNNNGNATQRPSWCDEPWCYVDPCACDKSDLHSSGLFGQSHDQIALYYSYATCGADTSDDQDDQSDGVVSQDSQREMCLNTRRWWSGEQDDGGCRERVDSNGAPIQDAFECRVHHHGELWETTCAQIQDELQHQGELQHGGGQLRLWQLGRSAWSQCCDRTEFPRQCPTLQASSFEEAEQALCRDRGVARERLGGQGCFYKHNHTLMSHFPPLPKNDGRDPNSELHEACYGWYYVREMTCEELLPVVFTPPGGNDTRSELQRCLIADELAARCCRNEKELGGSDVRGYSFGTLCPEHLNGEYRFFKMQDGRPVYRHDGNRRVWMEYNEPEGTYEIFEDKEMKVRLTSPSFEINLPSSDLKARFLDPECLDYLPDHDLTVLQERTVNAANFALEPRGCTTVNKQKACDAEAVSCKGGLGCGAEESDHYESKDN